ncbi:MAG: FG-GAP-like repeat-containing protein [Bacteroidales bacterium]
MKKSVLPMVFLLLLTRHLSYGQTDFGDRQIISNEIQDGRNMLVMDYNRDNFPDIFVLSESDSLLLLFENKGLGYFKEKIILEKLPSPARDIVAADFNQDGWDDIAVSCRITGEIFLLKNISGIGFAEKTLIGVHNQVKSIYAEDPDQDGDTDIFSLSGHDYKIRFFENTGEGAFASSIPVNSSASNIGTIAFEDIDGDGETDIVSGGISFLQWFKKIEGEINYHNPQIIDTDVNHIEHIEIFDINQNGTNEIVVLADYNDAIKVYYQEDSTGNYSDPETISAIDNITDFEFCDFDNDGAPDLLISTFSNSIRWHKNLTNGIFAEQQLIIYMSSPTHVCAADFNLDGKPDVAGMSVSTMLAWAANLGETKVGDFDGNPDISVFPVPANNTIVIDAEDDQIIYNLVNQHGQIITKLHAGSNDISDLAPGVYFIMHNDKTVSRIIRK